MAWQHLLVVLPLIVLGNERRVEVSIAQNFHVTLQHVKTQITYQSSESDPIAVDYMQLRQWQDDRPAMKVRVRLNQISETERAKEWLSQFNASAEKEY